MAARSVPSHSLSIAIVSAASLLTGCAITTPRTLSAADLTPLPVYQSGGEINADLEGVLVLREGCVLIRHGNGAYTLPIWPAGAALSSDGSLTFLSGTGPRTVRIGKRTKLLGIRFLSGQPIPESGALYRTRCPGELFGVVTSN